MATGIEGPGALRAYQSNETSAFCTVPGNGHINSKSTSLLKPEELKVGVTVFQRIPPRLPVAPMVYAPGTNPGRLRSTTLTWGSAPFVKAAGRLRTPRMYSGTGTAVPER